MKRRRSIGFLMGTGVLLVLVVFLLVLSQRGKDRHRVVLPGNARVDEIRIRDNYDSLRLELRDQHWVLEGMDSVSLISVENLLYAATRFQVDAVVTSLPRDAAQQGRDISFFRQGKRILAYRLYSTGERYFIHLPGAARYLGVSLPGYQGLDLEEVFSLNRGHYLEHVLVHLMPSEISWIQVERRGEEAFRISMDQAGNFQLSFPRSDSVAHGHAPPLPPGELDTLSLRLLFSYFTDLRFEMPASEYEGSLPSGDSGTFMARLQLVSRKGEQHHLEVHSLPVESRSDDHLFKACVYYNQGTEPLIINYIYLDVLMRPLAAYFGDKL